MTPDAVSRAIHDVVDLFTPEVARTQAMIDECHRLSYEASSVGRTSLSGHNSYGCDEFDSHSKHIALVSRADGKVMATVRLVLPVPGDSDGSFPMRRIRITPFADGMPFETTAEVSRFAVSRMERRFNQSALMRLALIQGLVRASGETGLTHWCAALDPPLLRLLDMTAVHLARLGPPVRSGGLAVQPCFNSISAILDGARRDRPPIWDYLTENGRLWPLSCGKPGG